MENNRVVHDMRMTWNTRGTAKDLPPRDPWNWPGKLVMGQNISAKEYLVYESNSEIITDGVLNEDAYTHAQCVAQVSARNADPQVQNLMRSIPHTRAVEEAATQIVESYARWLYWPNFNDALVTWRAVTDSTKRKLHLAFTVVDDVPDSNNQSAGINIIEDDGLLFMIDLNKNNRREATDFGFTILRSGKIYKYTGFAENYDSLYTGKSVIAKTGKFGPTKNWAAEIEVNLPNAFKPGDTLRIELGYNDADAYSIREHQLMWSTVTTGKTPWSDYSNLGRFILTGKQPPTSVAAPRETLPMQFVLSPSYPNPFTAGTSIAFGLFKRQHVSIKVYDLVGRLVTTLVDRPVVAGAHSVQWYGTDAAQRYVANGVYFVRMSAGAFTQTQKMIFLRGR
ncbi:T9SS type A sorting domain-containing protein [candidate division KSB1 bacterium]|nr:T9SS type A sorting domain-containing protein [candidate division KSB1 bacterium]